MQITEQVFVAEQWCRENRKLADVEALSRAEVEKALEALKQEHYELFEKLKEVELGRKSAEVDLKTAKKQVEDQCQMLYVTKTNLATEKQVVLDLKAALQRAKEEARLAKEEAQLVKEAVEAEKRASYQLGAEETEAKLSEELPEVCRDYCSISWAHALNAAGIPTDSALRLPEKVFFPPEIQEIPADTTEASEQVTVVPDAIPLTEIAGGSSRSSSKARMWKKRRAKVGVRERKPPQRLRILLRKQLLSIMEQISKSRTFHLLSQSKKKILLLRLSS